MGEWQSTHPSIRGPIAGNEPIDARHFAGAGVSRLEGMIWRMLKDDPKFDTANCHGEAERRWGLIHANGSPKAAYGTFVAGIQQERAGATTTD